MEGIAEFDMLWNGQLETFNVEFEYEVFFDCYVTGEAGSDFLDWEYRTKELYFENEEGETVIVDHNLLRPEFTGLIDFSINKQIEKEIL